MILFGSLVLWRTLRHDVEGRFETKLNVFSLSSSCGDFAMKDKEFPSIYVGTSASASTVFDSEPFITRTVAASHIQNKMKQHPVTLDIPEKYLTWIGRIITHWAFAEWVAVGICCLIYGKSRKEGRILFTGRTKDIFKKIKDKLILERIDLVISDVQSLYTECEGYRDLLGHGIWLNDSDSNLLCIQETSGEWELDRSVSKRFFPKSTPIDELWFQKVSERISLAVSEAQKYEKALARLMS